jgi:hypothetical protein
MATNWLFAHTMELMLSPGVEGFLQVQTFCAETACDAVSTTSATFANTKRLNLFFGIIFDLGALLTDNSKIFDCSELISLK